MPNQPIHIYCILLDINISDFCGNEFKIISNDNIITHLMNIFSYSQSIYLYTPNLIWFARPIYKIKVTFSHGAGNGKVRQ